jgi:tetratricopeptide (TPR) repeat protein
MIKIDFKWQLHKWRAITFIVLGRKSWATETFEDMLIDYPNDAYALGSLAHLYAEAGNKQASVNMYKKLVAKPDAPAFAWYNLGYQQEEMKQVTDAEFSFRRALELDEKLDMAWYGLGLVLIQQQRFEEAIKALKRNTQLQPMSPYAWYQLARVHMDRQQPEEAVKIIRHLKGFEPKFAAQLERETGLEVKAS